MKKLIAVIITLVFFIGASAQTGKSKKPAKVQTDSTAKQTDSVELGTVTMTLNNWNILINAVRHSSVLTGDKIEMIIDDMVSKLKLSKAK